MVFYFDGVRVTDESYRLSAQSNYGGDGMEEPKPDLTRPRKREQCYLCFMTLVEDPPPGAPPIASLRRSHKEFMADLERRGLLLGAGKLENSKQNEKSDYCYAMFILRAGTRKEAESIGFQKPDTKAGLRKMTVVTWQRRKVISTFPSTLITARCALTDAVPGLMTTPRR